MGFDRTNVPDDIITVKPRKISVNELVARLKRAEYHKKLYTDSVEAYQTELRGRRLEIEAEIRRLESALSTIAINDPFPHKVEKKSMPEAVAKGPSKW